MEENKGNKDSSESAEKPNEVSLEFVFPDDQRALFSNYATVQREGQDFHLSFFDIRPPIVMGTEEERKSQVNKLKSVKANCLGRIVISGERAEGLVFALQDQLNKSK